MVTCSCGADVVDVVVDDTTDSDGCRDPAPRRVAVVLAFANTDRDVVDGAAVELDAPTANVGRCAGRSRTCVVDR